MDYVGAAMVTWLVVAAVLVFAGYLCLVARAAYQDTENAPKKEMFICDVHGPMSREATFTLFGGDMEVLSKDGRTKREPVLACPMCLEQKIAHAKK